VGLVAVQAHGFSRGVRHGTGVSSAGRTVNHVAA
jgi:hypothetical protein